MKKVNVNFKRIIDKNKTFQKKAEAMVKEKYQESKLNFLNDFNDHPVTQELEAGNNASNISRTLNGIGNLFSFIGFYQNDNPIGKLKNIINQKFSIKKTKKNDGFRFIINYPSLDKLKAETPLPWEGGKSWVLGVEKGISGFGNYMYKKFTEGRSKEALQAENKIRSSSYKQTKYISELINNFIKDMKS